MTGRDHRRCRAWLRVGVVVLLMGLQACGSGEKKEEKVAAPAAPTAAAPEAAISGTITLDPSLKDKVPKDPLLLIFASNSAEPTKPPIVAKRIAGVAFPYQYKLTAEDITLVGSTFDGKMYVTARIDPAGMVGPARPGTFDGAYSGNPVAVGSSAIDIVINKAH